MKNILIFLSFILLSSLNSFSQTDTTIEESYTEYFKLPREALFIHLNKTKYILGEEIWFKVYAFDRKNNLSSKGTSNINVGIYNTSGKQILKKLFLANNGSAAGNFLVDSTFIPGSYYIKASTNWMRNFIEDDSYIQKIKILSSKNKEIDSKISYDFQFLPEGGHIIANTKNVIGFKFINSFGKGIEANGILYDENNKEITTFKSNQFGIGKFFLHAKNNVNYKAKINLKNGKSFTKNLPKIKSEGVSIIVNNLNKEKVIINLYTNNETLSKISSQKYKLIVQKDGEIKIVTFSFNNDTEKLLAISKSELFKGVNIITLFNSENRPILERLFFNEAILKPKTINLTQLKKTNDSITISLYSSQINLHNLSISVLPKSTVSYNPNQNIISSFYLKPYINGYIENPKYYFTNIDRKKKYELDILLLTQGWSRYKWDDIFNNPPKMKFNFEKGITINGKINYPKSGIDSLYLYSTSHYYSQFIPINKDNTFKINNFYFNKDEALKFSYVNKKMQFLKPNIYLTYETNTVNDVITINSDLNTDFELRSKLIDNNFVKNNTVNLKQVLVTANTKVDKEESLTFKNNTTEMTDERAAMYSNVVNYIKVNGYDVFEHFGKIEIQTRAVYALGTDGAPTHASPVVYLDDIVLQDLSILSNFKAENIKKITIDKSGFGQGVRGTGGTIKIYTKDGSDINQKVTKTNSPFQVINTTTGFNISKSFYTPKYESYSNNFFKEYGVIGWYPNITLNNKKSITLKILNTNTESVNFYIEGLANDGSLISEIKTLIIK